MPAETIHQECTSLQERVLACESLLDVLDGLKYIDGNPVALEDGSGYQLNVVSVTKGENNQWTVKNEEPIVIKHGSKGDDGHTPVVTIKDGNWWIDGVDTGEKAVPADGKDAPTPTFHIWDGVLWYTFAEKPDTSDNGKPTAEDTKGWTSLGNVVGPKGETGEQGPQGPEGIHGLEITRVTDENDPNYGAVKISYKNGEETVTEYLPTYEMFLELKTKVEDAEKNITALQSLANAIDNQIFVTGYELVCDNGIVVGCKISTIKIKSSTDANGKVTYTSETETLDVCPNDLLRLKKDAQGWYWEIKGDNTRHYLDAEVTFVPDFKISGGHLYVSLKDGANKDNINDDEFWKDLGTVQTILAGHDGDSDYTSGDPLVSIKQENGKVIFTFAGSDPIEVPTQTAFAALVERVTALENNAQAFNTMLTALKSYKFVKNFEVKKVDGKPVGFIITLASYIEKYENGEFMGYELSTEVQTIDYSDAGLLSVTLVNGEYHWQLPDGTKIPVDGTFVPEFRINDADGKLYVSLVENPGDVFTDVSKWQCLGLVTPEIAAGDKIIVSIEEERNANNNEKTGYLVITLRNPSDPNAPNETLRLPTANAFETLKERVETVNDNLVALQTSFNAHEKNYHVKSISAIPGGLGYTIVYTNNGVDETVTFVNGKDGAQGKTPALRIGKDGYWEYKDEYGDWVDVKCEGEKVSAVGNTPKLKIGEDGFWYVSYQNGADGTWESTNVKATGNDGTDGASFFNYVTPIPALDADGKEIWNQGHKVYAYIEIRVPDGDEDATNDVVYTIPTEWTITQLQAQVDALNGNVAALSELVKGQKYIESYAPKADGTGYDLVIKYYENNQWVTKTLEIINGKNPVLGFVKGDDGYDYWAYADENGNLVKFDPAVRANGVDGKIPEFNLTADGKLQYSFNGTDWTTIDKVLMRDSFFSNVKTIEEEETITDEAGNSTKQNYVAYLEFTLAADGQSYKVPTAKKLQKLADRVANLEANVDALETLVAESTFVKNITTRTATDSNGYEYVNGFDAVMVKYQKVNGVWTEVSDQTYPKKITYTDDKITLVKNTETGAWEWKIKTNDADYPTTITLPASGGAPRFELFNGRIYVAIDPRANTPETDLANDSTKGYWRDLGLLNPGANVDGGAGNSLLSVDTNDNGTEVTFKFTDGTEIVVPTQSAFEDLNDSVAQLNKDVTTLQNIVNTIQDEDYVTSYVELKEDTANPNTVTGIRLHFKNGGSVDIDYGKDGVAPEINVEYGDDNILYWTIGGQPLYYPGTQNRVPASYPTPIFDVTEDGELRVSYDGGTSYSSLGKVVGEQGDSMFKNVELSEDGMFILVTLNDDVEYKLPVWQDLSITLAQNSLSFTTGQELSVKYTIKGPLSSGMPEVATIAEGDWTATYTIEDKNDSQMSGYIVITAPAEGQRLKSGKVLVFASIHGQTVMRSITTNTNSSFGSEGAVDTNATEFQLQNGQLNLDYRRRDLTLKFTTNTVANQTAYDEDYYLEAIYDDVDNDWIKGVTNGNPMTRAIPVTNQITIKTNTGTYTRSATIKVMKRGSSGAVYTFQIRQSGVKNLNANSNYANCFIVSEPGVYKFTAVKGYDNTTGFISGINSRSVLWAKNVDGKDLSLNNIRVYEAEDLGSGVVIFEVGTYVAGNAVIQVSNDSSVLWSWHIWFRAKPGNTNSGTMMDWNLGASGATDEGLYYQWGRKDPFYGKQSVVSGGTEANGIANPDTFYGDWNSGSWTSIGDGKTIYDPCPNGYKVPSLSVFGTTEEETPSTNYATIDGLRYRYGGYLYPDTESGVAALREESQKGVLWLSDVAETTPMHLYYERWKSYDSLIDWYDQYSLFISTNNKDKSGNDISKSQAHGLNVRCVKE